MPNFNCVILAGHATRDVETRSLANGGTVSKWGLAVNGWKENDVLFIDVAAFGKTADAAARFVKKGSAVQIRGRLQLEQWDDKATGAKRSKISAIADELVLLGGGPKQQQQSEPEAGPVTAATGQAGGGEEIPF